MKSHWIRIIIFLLILSAAIAGGLFIEKDLFDIHHIAQHKQQLLAFIGAHYFKAVLAFIALFIATALFLPGALVLSIVGGMLFGTLAAVVYVDVGATAGAVLAFVAARFVIGRWFQERFKEPLGRFNEELALHGKSYLLVLRILPIAPFCVINYCAGITNIPLRTFVWTTSLGIIPGAVIHAFVGHQLRDFNTPADLFSWRIMLALGLLALFALFPVILHHLPGLKRLLTLKRAGR